MLIARRADLSIVLSLTRFVRLICVCVFVHMFPCRHAPKAKDAAASELKLLCAEGANKPSLPPSHHHGKMAFRSK